MELKNKSLEEKIEALKAYLADENNEDIILALNLYNLIKYDNSWDESFFQHENIIFNSILEFIQIKNALKNELNTFCLKLLNIYYSCIYNCGNLIVDEDAKPIPALYKHILLQGDFIFMSKLANDYKFTSFDNTVYSNAMSILIPMINKLGLLYNFMSYNMETLETINESEQQR